MIPFHKQKRPRVDRGRNKEEKRPILAGSPYEKEPVKEYMDLAAGVISNRATAGWARRKSEWDFI